LAAKGKKKDKGTSWRERNQAAEGREARGATKKEKSLCGRWPGTKQDRD